MKNLKFVLRFIKRRDNGDYYTVNHDITEYVKGFNIDPLKFFDDDTLLISERKAKISGLCIRELIESNIEEISQSPEIIETDEYDLNFNPINESDFSQRKVLFLAPFLERIDSMYQWIYKDGKIVFPASYNPGEDEPNNHVNPNIHLVPVRYWHENEYNSYSESFVIEKPVFCNIVLEVTNKENIVYTGLGEIESISYNPSGKETSISFTDIVGIFIHCLDSFKNLPTFYQNVYNSGLILNHTYELGSLVLNNLYPQLTGIFSVQNLYNSAGTHTIRAVMKCGKDNEGDIIPAHYKIIIQSVNDDFTYIHNYEVSPNTYMRQLNYFRDVPYVYVKGYGGLRFRQHEYHIYLSSSGEGWYTITFCEAFKRSNTVFFKTIDIIIHIESANNISVENMFYEDVVPLDTYNNQIIPVISQNTVELYKDLNWTDKKYGTGNNEAILYGSVQYGGAVESTAYMFDMNNINNDIIDIVPLCNDEGFNTNPDLLSVYKIGLFANGVMPVSSGYNLIHKQFAYSGNPNKIIDGYYILEINITKGYWEKPELSDFEQITDWDRKKIKSLLLSKINIISADMTNNYNIKISSACNIFLELGDMIKIVNIDDINTEGIEVVLTSINYTKNGIEVEGYGI
jgi:hypothetical protein